MRKDRNNDGFEKYFKLFYLQYAGEMICFARKFVDIHVAEDIVHDIFLNIWDRKSTIVVEEEIRNYLFSMVRNACYDFLKHQQVKDEYLYKSMYQLKLDELEYYESQKEYLWDNERVEALYAAIDKLPSKSRDVFKKAYLEGKKHVDIAKELNISVRTVEAHVYKSLKYLRDCHFSLNK